MFADTSVKSVTLSEQSKGPPVPLTLLVLVFQINKIFYKRYFLKSKKPRADKFCPNCYLLLSKSSKNIFTYGEAWWIYNNSFTLPFFLPFGSQVERKYQVGLRWKSLSLSHTIGHTTHPPGPNYMNKKIVKIVKIVISAGCYHFSDSKAPPWKCDNHMTVT